MNKFNRVTRVASVVGVVMAGAASAHAAESDAKFEVYGFAQADYIQDFKRVNPAWDDTLRPSRIPTQAGLYGSDGQAIISVKQSRFGANMNLPVSNQTLKTKFEFDMFGVGPDEGKTTIRLRHAYGEWGQWLAGQTHSLFMDIDAFPNVIDYWGPTGLVFLRNPQIRWQPVQGESYFAVAIEKPSDDIDAGQIRTVDPTLGTSIQADEKTPDLTAQIRQKMDWGFASLGGIVRRIGFETLGTPDNSPRGFKVGWGADLSTGIKFREKDRLILSGVYGQGIASYMNDGGTDLAPDGALGSLAPKAVPLFGLTAYYELAWTSQLMSTFGYSRTQVENTTFQNSSAYFRGEYASFNLLCTPVKDVMFGGEFLWGRRVDHGGASGIDTRAQISVKYSFSSLTKSEGT